MVNKNKNSHEEVKKYLDLLYMTPQAINAKDIALVLEKINGITTQLWEEMNILELELANEYSVDFEPIATAFQDPFDASFINKHNIKTIFALSLCEKDLNTVVGYFNEIISQYSGFLCADSEDFTPVYAGILE